MDEVAAAIADPVRRDILVMLRDRPLTAGEIAGNFRISRPAISRHLRVLRECGLVRDTAAGRQRVYELDTTAFGDLTAWLGGFTRPDAPVWEQRLDALGTEVHRTRREHRHRNGTDQPQEKSA